jgi:hypothetical protein
MRHLTLEVPEPGLSDQLGRLDAAGVGRAAAEGGTLVRDPAGNGILLVPAPAAG